MRSRHIVSRLTVSASLLTASVGTIAAHAQAATDASPAIAPAATMQAPTEIQGGTVSGMVTSLTVADANGKAPAGAPLPGVTVTATNTLTGKKYSTATDSTGAFRMAIPRNGRYVLRAEFAAFAAATSEVLLNATQHTGTADFSMELASRVAARTAASGGTSVAGISATTLAAGLQSLTGTGATDAEDVSAGSGAAGAELPTLSALGNTDTGTDSVAVSGQAGRVNGLAGFNEDDIRDRIQGALDQARQAGGAQADIANAVVSMVSGMMNGGPGGFGGPGGGGPGGPGGGPGGGGPGGGFGGGGGFGRGGFRNFNPTAIHGNAFYDAGNALLDATPFSITGNPLKPGYSTNRFGLSFTGSPYIPGLIQPNTKQNLFINLTGQRNQNPTNIYATVPTLAQRAGNFNGLTQTINGTPTAVTLYDPTTGLPYGNCSAPTNPTCNVIPAAQLNASALALLQYFPMPNTNGTGGVGSAQNYNYQRVTTAGQHQAQLAARFSRSFGNTPQGAGGRGGRGGGGGGARGAQTGNAAQRRQQQQQLRQSMNVNFSYSHSASDLRGLLPTLDGKTSSNGYNISAGYMIGLGRLSNNFTVGWNFSHAYTTNIFTGTANDPASAAGITVPRPTSVQPGLYNGVPSLQLTNFTSITDTNPADRLGETISFSDNLSWRHGKHNYRFGGDLRRVHSDLIAGTNGLGQLTFTGYSTQKPGTGSGTNSGTAQAPTGSSFADFLLGAPQTSALQAGSNKIYLREWVYDAFVQDDWRLLNNLTLNLGLRYEYFAPYTENNGRLVNLDHNADFTQFARVLPGQSGPYTGGFPSSLINPDRTLISPRIGVAWRPKQLKNTVVRAGYGINYNTGQYGTFANSLSYQQPFAVTETNVANSQGCGNYTTTSSTVPRTFRVTNAFSCTSASVLPNNFAVARDYRLGRVQVVNADIQRQLPQGIVVNVGYNGAFGGSLDLRRAPNRTATAVLSNTQAILYADSIAESRFHSLTINARKRLQKGIGLGATYQYGHSIDNASSIGGVGNNTVVQNDQRIDLEFGNSSFDVRHKLNGNYVYELPLGANRAYLKTGWPSHVFNNINLSGDFNFATGGYATPQYQNSVAQAGSGNNYTLRPDRVFSQPIGGAGTLRNWFNTAAFTAPSAVFGTASRNSIRLPGTVSNNMTLGKTISFTDIKVFEMRIAANNVFNTVQYTGVNTVLNSSTFGQVTGANSPRKLTFSARYRF